MGRGQASLTWGPRLTCTRDTGRPLDLLARFLLTATATPATPRDSDPAMVDPHLMDLTGVTGPGLVASTRATLRHRASTRQLRAGMAPAVPLVKEEPLLPLPASLAGLVGHPCGWELQEVPRATEVPGGLTPGHKLVTMVPATTAPGPEVTPLPPGQATRAIPAPPQPPTVCLPPPPPAPSSPVKAVREGRLQ